MTTNLTGSVTPRKKTIPSVIKKLNSHSLHLTNWTGTRSCRLSDQKQNPRHLCHQSLNLLVPRGKAKSVKNRDSNTVQSIHLLLQAPKEESPSSTVTVRVTQDKGHVMAIVVLLPGLNVRVHSSLTCSHSNFLPPHRNITILSRPWHQT